MPEIQGEEEAEEETIIVPAEATPPEAEVVEVPELEEEDELADLFTVPQPEDNDMTTDHLVVAPEEEKLDDLFVVSEEDIMGEAPAPEPEQVQRPVVKKKYRIIRREPPPTSLGGIR